MIKLTRNFWVCIFGRSAGDQSTLCAQNIIIKHRVLAIPEPQRILVFDDKLLEIIMRMGRDCFEEEGEVAGWIRKVLD